ncbi:hypothetical protein RJZ56_001023 [Blastomyces dermatitidis]
MPAEYAKKTNAELIEILKSRSLPHTGKKADLIARLQEADKADAERAAAAAPVKPTAIEDVIDWDDDAALAEPVVPAKPDASTATAAPINQVPNPTAVPNQKVDIDPSTTHDLKVVRSEDKAETASAAAGGDKAAVAVQVNGTEVQAREKPAVDYSIGLSATDLEIELAKRKARAEKFGIVEDSSTSLEQAKKAVERAKRFGTVTEDASIVKGLDEALPERSRKRERGDEGGSGRGGKRRDFRRGRSHMGRAGGRRGPAPRQSNGGNGNSWSEQDRIALERRKNRFG